MGRADTKRGRLLSVRLARPANPFAKVEEGTLPLRHPAAALFRSSTDPYHWVLVSQIALFLAGNEALRAAYGSLKPSSSGWAEVTTLLFAFARLVLIMGILELPLDRVYMRLLRVVERGRIIGRPNDLYVGVAYADGFWYLNGGTSWDRGYLRLEAGGLEFTGLSTSFRLPDSAIQQVRVAQSEIRAGDSEPRLFVDWTDPHGRAGTLSLQVRTPLRAAAINSAITALQFELSRRVGQASIDYAPNWPIAIPANTTEKLYSSRKVTPEDRSFARRCAVMVGLAVAAIMWSFVALLSERGLLPTGIDNPGAISGFAAGLAAWKVYEAALRGRVLQRLA